MNARRIKWAALWLAALAAPWTVACLDRDLAPLNPCLLFNYDDGVRVQNVEKVDLLFLVDDSRSMGGEQIRLAQQLPKLAGVLASGDLQWDPATGAGDGTQDFPPVKDLRVGVINSDLGSFGAEAPSCETEVGDDGILRTSGDTTSAGCADSYPPFLEFCNGAMCEPGAYTDVSTFATDFGCLAKQGIDGCGFEQQLEAVLKGLTPSEAPASGAFDGSFVRGSGHGDGANAGFVREDSLLAVLLLTDEDDCSVRDPRFLEEHNPDYGGSASLNIRCYDPAIYDDALFPVERYVDGLRALRADKPDLFVYAAITGVPPGIVADVGKECGGPGDCGPGTTCQGEVCVQDFDAVLEHPDMQFAAVSGSGTRLEPRPACTTPPLGTEDEPGKAAPARRITRVAQQLEQSGSNGLVQSICQEDFAPALDAILRKLADVIGGACLPRELNPNAQGKVGCDVAEVLPKEGEFTTCESLSHLGREPFDPPRVTDDGREVCRVRQIPTTELETDGEGYCSAPEGAVGWYYDQCSRTVAERCVEDPQRIAFAPGSEPKNGTDLQLECLKNVEAGDGGGVQLGSPCSPGDGLCAERDPHGESCQGQSCMTCEPQTRTCRLPCETDADCLAGNLGGYVCPTADEASALGLAARVCVNPTCGEL